MPSAGHSPQGDAANEMPGLETKPGAGSTQVAIPPQAPSQQAEPLDSTGTTPATQQQLQETEEKIEERMSAFERSMLRLTRAGVIVATLTGIIFFGQLYEMNEAGRQTDEIIAAAERQSRSTRDIRKAADRQAQAATDFAASAEGINKQTIAAVGEFGRLAKSSESSGISARNATRTDQRAWIDVIVSGKVIFQPNTEMAGPEMEVKNVGKTPAINITMSWTEFATPSSPMTDGEIESRIGPPTPGGFLQPNGFFHMTPASQKRPTLDQDAVTAITSGLLHVFFAGNITYDDVFGFHHRVKFSYIYNTPSQTFDLTQMHNEIDNENR